VGSLSCLLLAGCREDPAGPTSPPGTNPTVTSSAGAACSALAISGDPRGRNGATWTYTSNDGGVEYRLEGVLLVPGGAGPFPGVVVSHGRGGAPAAYSANVGRTMVTWGLVVIATRYTHAANNDGRNATFLPAGPEGASEANVMRAHKARDLLTCLGYVDMARVAAHGHSMGAFVTGQLLGRHGADFRAASHTAGGVSPGVNATQAAAAENITTPYQLHHGDQDMVVPLAFDRALDSILTARGARHELHVYAGFGHEDVAADARMFDRVRDWYTTFGVLR
jgi:dienelactone hydrolase